MDYKIPSLAINARIMKAKSFIFFIIFLTALKGFSQDTLGTLTAKHHASDTLNSQPNSNGTMPASTRHPNDPHATVNTNKGTAIPNTTSGTLNSTANPNTQLVIPFGN